MHSICLTALETSNLIWPLNQLIFVMLGYNYDITLRNNKSCVLVDVLCINLINVIKKNVIQTSDSLLFDYRLVHIRTGSYFMVRIIRFPKNFDLCVSLCITILN